MHATFQREAFIVQNKKRKLLYYFSYLFGFVYVPGDKSEQLYGLYVFGNIDVVDSVEILSVEILSVEVLASVEMLIVVSMPCDVVHSAATSGGF